MRFFAGFGIRGRGKPTLEIVLMRFVILLMSKIGSSVPGRRIRPIYYRGDVIRLSLWDAKCGGLDRRF